ncbi:tRNA pseudouridine(55) synthase TruB [Echinimonas agarilytica]|uniref:tRNA pseudouridine synthase B n=1 Tax=Echinimonas agarilytica TaxID=1215918 RepID=A0AA42B7V7_9GAMM|nr:tRNA pseudouridine(55) synthase TruB [Echinimonas agarilytica]MCM2679676.1 tRNA pseudouridine(55) synthase TruB [Echinimonas agarilytica]
MGRRRKGRPIDGVVLVDKPTGMSSNNVLQKVRAMFFAQKAGHTGALDPLATGMLPVCLGEATKFSQYLLDSDKKYRVVARLGQRTDTSDADGELISERAVNVSWAQVDQELEHFRGPILQTPTMFSALKHEGKPLYKYAREGITIDRPARPIDIYSFEIVSLDAELLTMDVHCSKGTYVRTLVDDLGEMLGCGAHVQELRRTAVAHYPTDQMMTMDELQALRDKANAESKCPGAYLDELLLPIDSAVVALPKVWIGESAASYVLNGNPVRVETEVTDGQVRIIREASDQFIGVGEIVDEHMLAPKRLVVPTHERVPS